MHYRIALDPQLNISAAELAVAGHRRPQVASAIGASDRKRQKRFRT
ncbi:MAG: hypothetical protein KDJ52_32495 [Anaerolineae bacterium]|nr:hypothetical protein [Anaerolineae bacterium]